MKSYINSVVISCSVLAASVSLATALDAQPQSTIVVGAGNDLRCRLEKGLRLTKAGEPITAKLVEPVYAGTTIAIPEGSTIKGHVSSISSEPRRKGQILRGDFTRPRTTHVTFDNVILPDGTAVQIHTDSTIGVSDVKTAQYLPKSQRPGVRKKIKDAAKPLSEPNKLQRLSQAAVTSLPYHPEYLSQGTIFDATLVRWLPSRCNRSLGDCPHTVVNNSHRIFQLRGDILPRRIGPRSSETIRESSRGRSRPGDA
jgi:hypothetical protein